MLWIIDYNSSIWTMVNFEFVLSHQNVQNMTQILPKTSDTYPKPIGSWDEYCEKSMSIIWLCDFRETFGYPSYKEEFYN